MLVSQVLLQAAVELFIVLNTISLSHSLQTMVSTVAPQNIVDAEHATITEYRTTVVIHDVQVCDPTYC